MLMYLLPVFSQTTRRSSLNPPPKTDMSWDEYLLYDTERSVDITSQFSLLQIQEVFLIADIMQNDQDRSNFQMGVKQ